MKTFEEELKDEFGNTIRITQTEVTRCIIVTDDWNSSRFFYLGSREQVTEIIEALDKIREDWN